MSIGEELESRFFKVLSCVSSFSTRRSCGNLLTPVSRFLGIDRDMRHHVDCDCFEDRTTLPLGQDVLCAMSGYRFVPEKGKERGDRIGKLERGSVINANGRNFPAACITTCSI